MIDIVEKLKNCPKGFKIYCPLFGQVEFKGIVGNEIQIVTILGQYHVFNKYGQYFTRYTDSECLLYPSQDQRDWNEFLYLEEGHKVVCSNDGINWKLGRYIGHRSAQLSTEGVPTYMSFKYIVPVENFDIEAENSLENCKYSI